MTDTTEKKPRPVTMKTIERAFAAITPEAIKTINSDDLVLLRDIGIPRLVEHIEAECKVRAAKLAGGK